MVLNQKYACDVQVGGTDQWTNLLSGVELIRRKLGKEAFAITVPLVTDAAGKKFGKSEGNAIWLAASKTSPFAFYQFWLNQPDDSVEKFLKMYTFMPLPEITALMSLHQGNPGKRKRRSAWPKRSPSSCTAQRRPDRPRTLPSRYSRRASSRPARRRTSL